MAHSFLSKINFILGRNPQVNKRKDWRIFIPEPHRAVIIIQADFEMAWAWRWSNRFFCNPNGAREMAKRERRNIPKILDLCDEFNVPITWATVGHLFLETCNPIAGRIHSEIPRLVPFENEFWKFPGGDWFAHDPGTDLKQDPEWYASDLVRDILGRKTSHEIGCHTFSHIDCRDDVCPPDLLRAELSACRQIAKKYGILLRSFVHPAHAVGNLGVLSEYGFTSFRTDNRNVLGYPIAHGNGLWELEQTAEFAFRPGWSVDYHISRYRSILRRAIKTNTICVFWFHPSFSEVVVETIFPEIFRFIRDHHEFRVCTTDEYITFLNAKNRATEA